MSGGTALLPQTYLSNQFDEGLARICRLFSIKKKVRGRQLASVCEMIVQLLSDQAHINSTSSSCEQLFFPSKVKGNSWMHCKITTQLLEVQTVRSAVQVFGD